MLPVKITNIFAFGLWRHFSPVFSVYVPPPALSQAGELFGGGFKDLNDLKVLRVVRDLREDFFSGKVSRMSAIVSDGTRYMSIWTLRYVRFDRAVAHKFLILAEIGLWYSVCSTIRRITNTKIEN